MKVGTHFDAYLLIVLEGWVSPAACRSTWLLPPRCRTASCSVPLSAGFGTETSTTSRNRRSLLTNKNTILNLTRVLDKYSYNLYSRARRLWRNEFANVKNMKKLWVPKIWIPTGFFSQQVPFWPTFFSSLQKLCLRCHISSRNRIFSFSNVHSKSEKSDIIEKRWPKRHFYKHIIYAYKHFRSKPSGLK